MKIPLFKSKSQWTTEVVARDKDGIECSPNSLRAFKWCVIGWLYNNSMRSGKYEEYLTAIRKALPKDVKTLGEYNDTHTFTEVQNLIKKANKFLK